MSIRVDKVQLQFEIDTKNKDSQSLHKLNEDIRAAYKSVQQLEKKHKELLSQPPKNKASQEYKDWKAQVSLVGKALQDEQNHLADLDRKKSKLINTMGKEKMTIHELQNELKQYNILLNNLTPGTESFNKVQEYVKDLKKQLAEYREEVNSTQSSLSKFTKGFNEISWAIQFAYQGMQKVVGWADQYVQSFAKMDEAMTDVMKYTGQTKQEVEEMNETVWLTQAQMAELFRTTPQNVTIHIKDIYEEEELSEDATCKQSLQVRKEGKRTVRRNQKMYNLDVIISVGYRVKSLNGTKFRRWANSFLIIDDVVYLFGASLKDAGKKLFAYIRMQETSPTELLSNIR